MVTRTIAVQLAGRRLDITTSNGIFSPERVDAGTQVLLANVPAPPPGGNLLDLGCGWGPIALTLALESLAPPSGLSMSTSEPSIWFAATPNPSASTMSTPSRPTMFPRTFGS
jgi:16S rRNA G1207 methylase RsmC